MFKYIIKDANQVVAFESKTEYNNYNDAANAGYEYLDTWELLNNSWGILEVVEEN